MRKSDYSEYRNRLLDAAREIIFTEGLSGLTAGRLATRVGLGRTVIHYHFGTMDHLLAALIRQSFVDIRDNFVARVDLDNIGESIWSLYRDGLQATEAVRARALASDVVGVAYREAIDDFASVIAGLLTQAYQARGKEPEIPTDVMALVMLMSAQFAGVERALGRSDTIDALEDYVKSLFAISSSR